jgi:hypothetical protein
MRWMSHLVLIACCTLSAVMIVGTASWMESNTPLTADDALVQARQTVTQYCTQQKLNTCNLKLVDTTAPATWLSMHANTDPQWQFDFYSTQTGTVHVQVPESGQPHM